MVLRCLVLSLSALLVLGCSDSGGAGGGDDDDVAGIDAGVDPSQVTYYQHVKPLLDAKCTRCHYEGGIAPFSLLTYGNAKAYAGVSMLAINEGIMPPWKAEDDCNVYAGDFSLSDDEIALFNDWVTAGTPEGDPADEGDPLEVEDLRLSRVDVELSMTEPYEPSKSPDDYRCFLIEWPEEYTTTQYISGFNVVPGNDSIVHHVIAFLATPEMRDEYLALDAGEAGPGYTCFGGPRGSSQEWIGGWAPGGQGFDMPVDTGLRVEPGSLIVLQVHYNTLFDDPAADVTGIQLKVDSTVDKEVRTQPWANPGWLQGTMNIPANDTDVMHSFQFDMTVLNDGKPFLVHSAGLHMHTLGTRGVLKINRANGDSDCLLKIDDWDFNWQDGYALAEPERFEPGDQMYLECHWDNSLENQPIVDGSPLPPRDVNWGDGSTDEMCLGVLLLTEP